MTTMKLFARILFLISIAEVIASSLFPLYATFVQHIGGSLFAVGSTLALQSLLVGVVTILSGRIAAKHKTERLHLVVGYSISTIVFLAYPHITQPYQLIYPQIAEGIALGLIIPAFQGLYSTTLEEGKHTSSWGDYIGAANIASAAALFFSGIITERFGYAILFYTIATFQACTIIGSIALFKLLPDGKYKR
jgi:predicted MFS family arabinose efflux permease